jgi:hypothetical protein
MLLTAAMFAIAVLIVVVDGRGEKSRRGPLL